MTCKATTPLVSRYSSSFIRPVVTDLIPDEEYWIGLQTNPITKLMAGYTEQQATIVVNQITRKLDNIISELPDSTLEKYPTLWNKVYQSSLNKFEVADFLYKTGYDPIQVNNELSIVPITSSVLGKNGIIEQLDFYFDNNLANSISGGFCAAFANIFAKIGAIVAIGKKLSELFNLGLPGILDLIRKKIESIIDALKEKLLAVVNQIKDKALALMNTLKGSIEAIANQVQQAAQKVQEFFSDLSIQKVKDQIKGLINKLVNAFETLTPEVLLMMAFRFCQLTEQVQQFFQQPVQDLQNTVTRFQSAHENTTRMGKLASFSAASFGAKRLSPGIIEEHQRRMREALNRSGNGVNSYGGSNSFAGGDGGGGTAGTTGAALGPTRFATTPFTPEEYQELNNITDNGHPKYLTFQPSVLTMDDRVRANVAQYLDRYAAGDRSLDVRQHVEDYNANHHRDGAGWKMIVEYNPGLFLLLFRASDAMEEQFGSPKRFRVNSGFRSLYYNFWINYGEGDTLNFAQIMAKQSSTRAVRTSPHQSAAAVDISTRGWSNAEKAFFIAECSRQRARGIGIYNTFIHVDIRGNYRSWGPVPSWAREAISGHQSGRFRNGTNPVEPAVDAQTAPAPTTPDTSEPSDPISLSNVRTPTAAEIEAARDNPNTSDRFGLEDVQGVGPSGDNLPSRESDAAADYAWLYPGADLEKDQQTRDDVYNGKYSDGDIVDFYGGKARVVQTSEETDEFYAGFDIVPI